MFENKLLYHHDKRSRVSTVYMGGDFEHCNGLFIFVCPPLFFFFAECGKSSSLQLEVSSGWTAEFEHGLFYATGCQCHNSARHPQSQISRLTHDSRSGGQCWIPIFTAAPSTSVDVQKVYFYLCATVIKRDGKEETTFVR